MTEGLLTLVTDPEGDPVIGLTEVDAPLVGLTVVFPLARPVDTFGRIDPTCVFPAVLGGLPTCCPGKAGLGLAESGGLPAIGLARLGLTEETPVFCPAVVVLPVEPIGLWALCNGGLLTAGRAFVLTLLPGTPVLGLGKAGLAAAVFAGLAVVFAPKGLAVDPFEIVVPCTGLICPPTFVPGRAIEADGP